MSDFELPERLGNGDLRLFLNLKLMFFWEYIGYVVHQIHSLQQRHFVSIEYSSRSLEKCEAP